MSEQIKLAREHTTKGHPSFVSGCPICEKYGGDDVDKKGKGWFGDSLGHSKAAKRSKANKKLGKMSQRGMDRDELRDKLLSLRNRMGIDDMEYAVEWFKEEIRRARGTGEYEG